MKFYVLIFLINVLLAGCAATSDVLPLGPDTYKITTQEHNITGGLSGAESNALQKAGKYCAAKNKELLVKSTSNSFDRPFYTYSVIFRCLNSDDLELKRPNY